MTAAGENAVATAKRAPPTMRFLISQDTDIMIMISVHKRDTGECGAHLHCADVTADDAFAP